MIWQPNSAEFYTPSGVEVSGSGSLQADESKDEFRGPRKTRPFSDRAADPRDIRRLRAASDDDPN